ncbi:Alpha-L-arabinofuranosidase 1, partial [Zea mays]
MSYIIRILQAIVSEYAVTGNDAGRGTLIAALAEAVFLIGLERNSDVVEMASCAPLFVNGNDQRWNPDAIVFNSWQHYGCPNYWMQVVNFGSKAISLNISVTGLETDIQTFGSINTVLTSGWLRDENSFQQPDKVVPTASPITNVGKQMSVILNSYSLTSFDLLLDSDQTMPSVSGSSLHPSVWIVVHEIQQMVSTTVVK